MGAPLRRAACRICGRLRMSNTRLIILAGGGTGGHLYPAIAVAHALRELDQRVEMQLFCTERPIDAQILGRLEIASVTQQVRPFRSAPWYWPAFYKAWRASCRMCRDRMRRRPPAVVLGTGGFGAGPAIHVAHRMGLPTALLNPDAIPGRGNRHLARMADAIFVQWPETVSRFSDKSIVRVTGCPVRREFTAATRDEGIRRFELDPHKKVLLVTGASQGARTLNLAVLALLPELRRRDDWQVLHLSGQLEFDRVLAAYREQLPSGRVLAFTPGMPAAMAAADLVVSRAGASTLAELTATGKPSILLPYPFHSDQHQWANAQVLVRAGAAIAIRDQVDPAMNSAALSRLLLPLMADPGKLAPLAAAAASIGRPDAAAVVAQAVRDMAEAHGARPA